MPWEASLVAAKASDAITDLTCSTVHECFTFFIISLILYPIVNIFTGTSQELSWFHSLLWVKGMSLHLQREGKQIVTLMRLSKKLLQQHHFWLPWEFLSPLNHPFISLMTSSHACIASRHLEPNRGCSFLMGGCFLLQSRFAYKIVNNCTPFTGWKTFTVLANLGTFQESQNCFPVFIEFSQSKLK